MSNVYRVNNLPRGSVKTVKFVSNGDRKIQVIDRTKSVKFTFNAVSGPIGLRSLTLPK